MNLTNLTKIALKALNNNKLRCFLTMLGIIIGASSRCWPSDKVRNEAYENKSQKWVQT